MKKASQYCKMSDHGYLGHFMQAKNIDRGHNDCADQPDPDKRAECEMYRKETADKKAAAAKEEMDRKTKLSKTAESFVRRMSAQ